MQDVLLICSQSTNYQLKIKLWQLPVDQYTIIIVQCTLYRSLNKINISIWFYCYKYFVGI